VVELVVFADVTYIKKLNGQQKVALKINGNVMGCNCNKAKAEGYSKDKYGNKISHAIRNLWEKSKQEAKPVNVTKINKK